MNESIYEQIQGDAKYLKVDLSAQEIATLAEDETMSPESIEAVSKVFNYLKRKQYDKNTSTSPEIEPAPIKRAQDL